MLMQQKIEEWVGTREASRLTGYVPEYLRELARTGKVKSKMVVTIWLYEKQDLLNYKQTMQDKSR